jgi:hypothetical protein
VLIAKELAVLLGKQRYNEGLISMLTDLFDSPDDWASRTKGQGEVTLKNVTLTSLWASTPDWLITAIPQDAFGGGFMSRLLLIVQQSTDRCFPIPEPPSDSSHLVEGIQRIKGLKGEMKLTPQARLWYDQWYAASRKDVPEDEKMAGYHERKPDHLLRLGMSHALAEMSLELTEERLVRSSRILHFLEDEMLSTFKWLGMKPTGQDQERLVRILRANGGRMTHSELLKKVIFFMNVIQFGNSIKTLTESNVVKEYLSPSKHEYTLVNLPGTAP